MTSRSRSPIAPARLVDGPSTASRAWLIAAALGLAPGGALAGDLPELPKPQLPPVSQDAPLYRDPDPSEGPRLVGPLLPARPPSPSSTPPPPPSNLGPFQGPGPGLGANAADGPEPIPAPLLGVPPTLPPLPAMLMPPMLPDNAFGMKRTTLIRRPNGVLGRCADWFHDLFRGPTAPTSPVANRRHFFGIPLWPTLAEGESPGSSPVVPAGFAGPSPALGASPGWPGRTLFGGSRVRESD